jgi:hypothetical protein
MKPVSVLTIMAALLLTACAATAQPSGQTGERSGFSLVLTGNVTDRDGLALMGVTVQIFVEGIVAATTKTNTEGAYTLELSIDPEADETVAVWWVASGSELVPELALIRESSSDREQGLWGPCVPRIGMIRRQTRSVRLLDHDTFRRELAESGCLDR